MGDDATPPSPTPDGSMPGFDAAHSPNTVLILLGLWFMFCGLRHVHLVWGEKDMGWGRFVLAAANIITGAYLVLEGRDSLGLSALWWLWLVPLLHFLVLRSTKQVFKEDDAPQEESRSGSERRTATTQSSGTSDSTHGRGRRSGSTSATSSGNTPAPRHRERPSGYDPNPSPANNLLEDVGNRGRTSDRRPQGGGNGRQGSRQQPGQPRSTGQRSQGRPQQSRGNGNQRQGSGNNSTRQLPNVPQPPATQIRGTRAINVGDNPLKPNK